MKIPSPEYPVKSFLPTQASLSFLQLQLLFNSLSDIVCAIDDQGRFVFVNAASIQILGFSPEELTGNYFSDFIIEHDRQRTREAISLIIQGELIKSFFNHYYHKDGSVVCIAWSGGWWDQKDRILFCVGQKTTDEQVVHNLHHQKEQKVTDFLRTITDGLLIVDESERILYWNKQAEIITGVAREQALGQVVWDCFSPEVKKAYYPHYQEIIREQKSQHLEMYSERLGMWIEFSGYPADQQLSVFFRDITERKNAEQELKKLSLIAKETENTVLISNKEGKIVWINDAFTQKTGYTFEEAVGQYPTQLLHGPETDPETIRYIIEQVGKGASFRVEILDYTKNKKTFWSEVHLQPIRDAEGNVQQYFAISTDITERKKRQSRLLREQKERQKMVTSATIKAQESERAQVSLELHDNVNQVLTTAKLYLEVSLDDPGRNGSIIKKSKDLINDSITEIRSLSQRLSSPSLGNLRLKDSVTDLTDSFTLTNQISINLDCSKIEDLLIDYDLHLTIYRILQEHLTNILKHAGADKVDILFDLRELELTLQVMDNGKGFDTKKKRKGIGITNMTTRAESVNGTLEICSTPGLGCRLLARFPIGV
ncbi:MAG: sensor histidine kinase [Flavisolibacter sp.]